MLVIEGLQHCLTVQCWATDVQLGDAAAVVLQGRQQQDSNRVRSKISSLLQV
jgi:hypothetical protein